MALIGVSLILAGLVGCAVCALLCAVIVFGWRRIKPDSFDADKLYTMVAMLMSVGLALAAIGFVVWVVGLIPWIYDKLVAAGF